MVTESYLRASGNAAPPYTCLMRYMEENFEIHRAYVRDLNDELASWYGYGGAGVLTAVGAVIGIAYWQGALTQISTYMVALTIGLVALYVLRSVLKVRKSRTKARLEAFCDVNNISRDPFVAYYQDGTYPFVADLFPST